MRWDADSDRENNTKETGRLCAGSKGEPGKSGNRYTSVNGWYEAEINGRGTYFHILAGRYKYRNYLRIPNHDVGCELSDFSNIFWNEERIDSLMRKVDAVTVATGLADRQGET